MTDHAAVILEWLMDEWTSEDRATRTPKNNPALAALAALEQELAEARERDLAWNWTALEQTARAEAAEADNARLREALREALVPLGRVGSSEPLSARDYRRLGIEARDIAAAALKAGS